MTQLVIAWLRLVIVITLVFLGVYGADQSALAQNVIIDSVVPAGTTEENDAIVAGQDVFIDGDIDGDLLILAIDATINGNVTGSVVTTAQTVIVNGQIGGSIYTVGRELILSDGSEVGRNVYFLGLRLETGSESIIGRDLVGVSLSARLWGQVGRDLKAVIGILELLGNIVGSDDVTPDDGTTVPDDESSGTGFWNSVWKLSQRVALNSIGGAAYQPFWPLVIDESVNTQKSMVKQDGIQLWARITLEEFVLLLLTGLFLVWRYSDRLAAWSDKAKEAPLRASGYGFVGIIVAVNIAILSVIAVILLFAIGFALGFASLWKLAFIFWALSLSIVGLSATAFFLFVTYGSKVIVAYMLSRLVVGLISEKAIKYRYLLMFFGLLIYVLLQSIPYVGGTINFIVIIIGLGSVWLVHRDRRQVALLASQPEKSQLEE
jgi:cytoskeletal protein CcmA (bactofilin family)